MSARCALALAFLVAQSDPPNAILLVAKPGLADPNFRETVVLVTQSPDAHTVGVILNRPTKEKHEKTGEPIYSGGPVMRQAIVALFKSDNEPAAPAFHVLKNIYLSMHPGIVEPLLARPGTQHRLYAGFSGWAPGQLESEMAREGWYVLPASEALVFRKDTAGMWNELVEKARGGRVEMKSPAYAGLWARTSGRCRESGTMATATARSAQMRYPDR
ncbi:MAG: YqgE/AlgH family protein [Pseudomonadota bacterium]|nr:YqgE/AlgH family protein [Pseudomonadota bacterium]